MDAEVYSTLTRIFRDVFRCDIVLKPELSGKDIPGWDSFKLVEIVLAVEERYGITLHTKELDSLQTVGDLASIVTAKANDRRLGGDR